MEEAKSSFENLEVWQLSRSLRRELSSLARSLPVDERFRLADQVVRASRSVTANIAEGHGRYHYQENIQYCRQARGSLHELIDHLTVALDENYIDATAFSELKARVNEIIRKLNGYIHYLSQRKKQVKGDECKA